MKRVALLVAVALTVLASALVTTRDAEAHALLARADPPINASLRESPTRITLFMTEQLQRSHSSVEVLDSGGQRRDIGSTEFSGAVPTQMSVRVLRLDPGVYTVVWETLSEVDGHTWTGSYVFSVLNPDGSAPAGSGVEVNLDRPGPPVAADSAVKAIGLGALVLFVGAVFVSALLRPSPLPPLVPLMSLAVVVGLVTTGYEAIAGALRLGDIGFLGDVLFDSRNGLWLQQRWYALSVAGLTLSFLTLRSPPAQRGEMSRSDSGGRHILVVLAVIAIAWLSSTSAISHGAAIGSGWIWGTLFDALHLAAVAIWIGGLAALLIAIRANRADRIESVRRFSVAAALLVPILVAAGLLSALIQIPDIDGIAETDWGATFIVKLVSLALLFAAAAANALLLRPRDAQAAGSDPVLVRRFSRMMRAEVVLGLIVIAVSGVLTQLPSPTSAQPEVEQKDNTIVETVARGDVVASLEISPNLVGFNTWTATVDAPSENPVEVMLLRFRYQDRSVGPVTVATTRLADGRFQLEGAYFGLPGDWTVEMEMRRASGDDLIAGVRSSVESGYQASPFAADRGGALALPLTQMDWNGVGALWAFLIAALAWINRPQIRARWGPRGGDAAFAGGVLGLIVAVVLLAGLHVEPGRTLANPVVRTEESINRGEALFARNCASCHGEQGAGDGPLADTLPAPPANFTVHVPFHPDGVLFAWITDGIRGTGMPAWSPQLSDQERWDLVNFLRASFDISTAQP
ncbi:MAG: c-type cytochrome [Chloroflexi bacterium]|nr:c-type cytochrome [Chloroflexota bacterium]MCY3696769.1 c-type cytochrome [Chloroflexota bacterium]